MQVACSHFLNEEFGWIDFFDDKITILAVLVRFYKC